MYFPKPLRVFLICAFASQALWSCKQDDAAPAGALNGIKVDDTVYPVDTVERDFSATGGALRLWSRAAGITGDMMYFRTTQYGWPTKDGVYTYSVHERAGDSTQVKFCFTPAGTFDSYCSVGSPSGTTNLTITVQNGKWSIKLPPTRVYGDTWRTIEVDVKEK